MAWLVIKGHYKLQGIIELSRMIPVLAILFMQWTLHAVYGLKKVNTGDAIGFQFALNFEWKQQIASSSKILSDAESSRILFKANLCRA